MLILQPVTLSSFPSLPPLLSGARRGAYPTAHICGGAALASQTCMGITWDLVEKPDLIWFSMPGVGPGSMHFKPAPGGPA